MEQNTEDLSVTPDVTTELPTAEEITTTTQENITPVEEVKVDEVVQPQISMEEVDALLAEILKPEEDEKPTKPVFEEKLEEEKEIITDSDLEELDNIITSLEESVNEKDKTIEEQIKSIEEITQKYTTIESDFKSKISELELLENWLSKISEHPVIWPLAVKLIQWEQLDIPKYLIKSLENDINAIPNMDWVNDSISSIPIVEKTKADKLVEVSKKRY